MGQWSDSIWDSSCSLKLQWSDGIWDSSYLSKLHFGPIRKLARHASSSNFCCNTRVMVEPDEALLHAAPIGEWVCAALAAVNESGI